VESDNASLSRLSHMVKRLEARLQTLVTALLKGVYRVAQPVPADNGAAQNVWTS
jgi:hypothetical protein